ncbi:Hypothetical protein NTJ_08508 [Nesidiocoris tenuis]|uniref:Ribosomal protein L23/L25 N-terminal domain-containing protein n=1 Tax=Nesidiocoris tenuis TaxID=355587 RepID=A0ABN7AU19_9HEMI|nr:Hypothetical protein NTJ_08508 [Nesidiocoris tenuis]
MPQGKIKKTKLPKDVIKKEKLKTIQKKSRPLFVPQKPAQKEVAKFKKLVSKSVNQKLEEEVRKIAFSEAHKVKLSQKKASNSSVDPNKMPPKAAT